MEERIFMFNVHATFRCCSLELGKCCRDYMSLKHLWDNVKMETAGSSYKIGENFTQEVPIPWSNKVRSIQGEVGEGAQSGEDEAQIFLPGAHHVGSNVDESEGLYDVNREGEGVSKGTLVLWFPSTEGTTSTQASQPLSLLKEFKLFNHLNHLSHLKNMNTNSSEGRNTVSGEYLNEITVMMRAKFRNYLLAVVEKLVENDVQQFLKSRRENSPSWFKSSIIAVSILDEIFVSQMQQLLGNALQEKHLEPPRTPTMASDVDVEFQSYDKNKDYVSEDEESFVDLTIDESKMGVIHDRIAREILLR
ncbi:hypothetical protein JRO89_XS11G0129000 [Xanthoceras sorbifolium]|uniref:Uncharacterized protein n=1 Tax=Xanthoceras sorbifolium TaxID=99658 RepID=A0ABQ8HFE9_9ROSI|nr:hypothetical protein JRO89_XS11G0129000 [Xanthoceras sorbifolium]